MEKNMDLIEQTLSNSQKINFLLETAISYHLEGVDSEMEMIINLIRDVNDANIKAFDEIV